MFQLIPVLYECPGKVEFVLISAFVDINGFFDVPLMYKHVSAFKGDWFTRTLDYMKANPETLEGERRISTFLAS